jgi:hypothetical protein
MYSCQCSAGSCATTCVGIRPHAPANFRLVWGANIKLAAVATDTLGVTGRAMLVQLLPGETDPAKRAELPKGKLRKKRAELTEALHGLVTEHHRFLLAQHLVHHDFLEEQIALFDAKIDLQLQVLSQQQREEAHCHRGESNHQMPHRGHRTQQAPGFSPAGPAAGDHL